MSAHTHDFKSIHLVLNKVSSYKIKTLNLRHYRTSVFQLLPNQSKGAYLLPKKECLKYTKKFTFGFDADSNRKQARQILSLVKSARPTSLTISSIAIYKLIDKLDIFSFLNNSSNLSRLNFAIEGSFIEHEIANVFNLLLLRSPNLKSLAINLKSCSLKPGAINQIVDGLMIQNKLENLVYNVSSADIGDQELLHAVQKLKSEANSLLNLKSLILSLRANRRVTDEGIEAIANLVSSLNKLLIFRVDLVNTSVTTNGLKTLLDGLNHNFDLHTFVLHASEISNLSSVLPSFFQAQPNLTQVSLDLSNDSKMDYDTLKAIQTSVASLPKLNKYKISVEGCHRLKEIGTFYVPESLGIFKSLRELEVHFASFLENEDKGQVVLESLIQSMSALSQLEALTLDFSTCSDWFTETEDDIQEKFLGSFPLMSNLKSLSLNFRKSQINPHIIQKLLSCLCQLKHLKSFEIDLSFCKSVKEKDLRGILLHLAGNLQLVTLKIHADDINYDENKLNTDIQLAVNSSLTLRELYISLKRTLMGRQAASLVSKFEPKHPGFNLSVKGGQAFTVIKPGAHNRNVFRPPVKSQFGKWTKNEERLLEEE